VFIAKTVSSRKKTAASEIWSRVLRNGETTKDLTFRKTGRRRIGRPLDFSLCRGFVSKRRGDKRKQKKNNKQKKKKKKIGKKIRRKKKKKKWGGKRKWVKEESVATRDFDPSRLIFNLVKGNEADRSVGGRQADKAFNTMRNKRQDSLQMVCLISPRKRLELARLGGGAGG